MKLRVPFVSKESFASFILIQYGLEKGKHYKVASNGKFSTFIIDEEGKDLKALSTQFPGFCLAETERLANLVAENMKIVKDAKKFHEESLTNIENIKARCAEAIKAHDETVSEILVKRVAMVEKECANKVSAIAEENAKLKQQIEVVKGSFVTNIKSLFKIAKKRWPGKKTDNIFEFIIENVGEVVENEDHSFTLVK